jgi:hypothetical protein
VNGGCSDTVSPVALQNSNAVRHLSKHERQLPITLRVIVAFAALAQLGLLLAASWVEWNRYSLGTDFMQYFQAFWLFGHGHVNPYDTFSSSSFYRVTATFIMLPLGLLWPITHSSFSLLAVQDVALAGCTVVGGMWIVELVESRLPERPIAQIAIVTGLVAAVAMNPYAFEAGMFDFHPEPIGALFLLLTARALWRGHPRSPFVWAALTISAGSIATIELIGLGLGVAVFFPEHRRRAAAVFLMAAAWLGVIVGVGLSQVTFTSSYGYLVPGSHARSGVGGAISLGSAIVRHPATAVHVLWQRRGPIYDVLRPGGIIGVICGWSVGVVLFDLLVNGLSSSYVFIDPVSGGFQNFAAAVFLAVGSVFVVVWLLLRGRWLKLVGIVIGLVALANSLVFAFGTDPGIPSSWIHVTPEAAAALAKAAPEIPESWQVVASNSVVGRFGDRAWATPLLVPCQWITLPVEDTAVILAPGQGGETMSVADEEAAVNQLKRAGYPVLFEGGGVWVFHVRRAHHGEMFQLGENCTTSQSR